MLLVVANNTGHKFHTPRNLVLALVGEVGELAEIFQWKGECAVGLEDWAAADKTHLGEELADCLLYLVRLSDRCGVDLTAAAMRKMDLNRKKYPIERCFGSSAKYTAYAGAEAGVPSISTAGATITGVADATTNKADDGANARFRLTVVALAACALCGFALSRS